MTIITFMPAGREKIRKRRVYIPKMRENEERKKRGTLIKQG